MAGHDESDHALARRVRRGEIAAFEHLFRRLHAPLCELVDSYVGSQAVAEEIVQDLFLAVWIDRARLRLILSPRAYLFGSARNRAVGILNVLNAHNPAAYLFDFNGQPRRSSFPNLPFVPTFGVTIAY